MKFLKNKRVIFAIIATVLFLVFFVGNFYTKNAYASNVYFTNAYVALEQLHSGDVIEQEFVLREGDEGVNVTLGTYMLTMGGGRIEAELLDSKGTLIGKTEVDLTGHMDNYPASLWFGELDESLYGQTLKIKMTFLDIDNELVTVYGSATDIDKYEATLNGEGLGWNITMDGIKATVFVEYSDFRNFFVCGFGILAAYLALFKIKWKELRPLDTLKKWVNIVRENWKKIVLTIGMILGCALIGNVAERYLSAESDYSNPYRAYAISIAVFIVVFAIVFHKYIWKRVHIFFMALVMLIGSVYIMAQPPTPVSHDEQLHYANTTYISWGATYNISVSDYYIYSMYTQRAYYDIFQKGQREAWVEEINTVDGQGELMSYTASTGLASIPYYLTAIVLYILRIFKFNFITRYLLGKFTNLFIYACCFGLSIKMLKGRGKLLMAMVGLIPTNILLASSYGYDWWVIAVVALGFAIFISELQTHDKISTKKFALSTLVICAGMLPKAVYFPLLLPMMLLKKDRYENSKKCRAITVIGALALVLSFILPLIISVDSGAVAGGGDIRGGSDVNAAGQIAFILGNLGEYMKVLFGYMKDYLNPDKSYAFLTGTAYQGAGEYFTVCLIVLAVAAALDNSNETVFKGREPVAVFGSYLGVFGAVVVVITALYVAYTGVGSATVSGCQPRYLAPIVFPFLFFVGENKVATSDEMKSKTFIWGALSMSLICLLTVYESFIIKY